MVLTSDEKREVEEKALQLLIERNETVLPMNPERLAKGFNIDVWRQELDPKIKGGLLPVPEDLRKTWGKEYFIVINDALNEQRSRYVTAHELGHYCLRDSECCENKAKGEKPMFKQEASGEKPKAEEQADLFARTLLMPYAYIKNAVALYHEKRRGDFATLAEYIARVFNVTEDKARKRLGECGFAES